MHTPSLKICLICDTKSVRIVEEPKYNGFRGICTTCGGNWPES